MHVTYRCITFNKWYDNKIYPPQFPLKNKLKVIKICPSFSEDNLRLFMLLSLDSSVQNAVYNQLQQCMQKLGVRIAFKELGTGNSYHDCSWFVLLLQILAFHLLLLNAEFLIC